jgi:hypothetical protein
VLSVNGSRRSSGDTEMTSGRDASLAACACVNVAANPLNE